MLTKVREEVVLPKLADNVAGGREHGGPAGDALLEVNDDEGRGRGVQVEGRHEQARRRDRGRRS